jgi:hypothetical protein
MTEPNEQTPEEGKTTETEPTTPPELQDSPWKSDIEAKFSDPEQRVAVDSFLRESVQPRVTQLEQATVANRDAERLWNDFVNDPVGTYNNVTEELFGADEAKKIQELISAQEEGRETELTAEEEEKAKQQLNDPRLTEIYEDFQNRKAREAYYNELEKLKAQHSEDEDAVAVEDELFHPFVVSADGDFDAAYDSYQEWGKKVGQAFGTDIPDEVKIPPTTVEDGQTVPPQTKKYRDLDEAMDDYFAEQKSPPTTVGNV